MGSPVPTTAATPSSSTARSPSPVLDRPCSPSEAYAVYEERVVNGVYDDVADGFTSMEHRALANASLDVDFRRDIQNWSGNYTYTDTRDGDEFKACVFGEVQASAAGTILCAKGNHYGGKPGGKFEPLGDDSKAKDVIVIGRPTLAPEIVDALYHNQLGTLNEIREHEEAEEKAAKWAGGIKEWIRNRKGNNVDVKDLITLHIGPKYRNPNGGAGKGSRIKKRAVKTAPVPPATDEEGAVSATITAGSYYEPTVLPDFGGPFFSIVHNKLVQQDIRDPDDQLIHPADIYSALRPGTLIMAEATLHAFLLRDNGGAERRVYQINAQSIRVLDFSKEHFVVPVRPSVPSRGGSSSGGSSSDSSMGSNKRPPCDAFANFKVNKKARLDSGRPVASGSPVASTSGTIVSTTPDAGKSPVASTSAVAKDRAQVKGKGKAQAARVNKKTVVVAAGEDLMME
ncbi:hypothetical protein FPV67DRAFT_1668709 [Lyophyllum atratum]|nr:hypothetical protein FPV67DRAFT_1668709 [Lyophyllum atratum]